MSRTASRPSAAVEQTAAQWVFRLDAGLTPAEEAEFRRWEAADPAHAAAIARHHRAWSALDRPRQSGQAGYVLEKLTQRSSRRQRLRRRLGSGLALAALLLTAALWNFRSPISDLPTPTRTFVLVQPEKRTLPDGSTVELRPGAAIAVDFSGPFRRVALQSGEAHFQVAHDAAHPFIVSAGGVDFRAVGTAFSVELGRREVELLVTEGVVAVAQATTTNAERLTLNAERSSDGPQTRNFDLPSPNSDLRNSGLRSQVSGFGILVPAGNRLVVDLPTATIQPATTVTPEEESARLAWRAPRLEFTDTPLAEAAEQLNRHNRVHFVIEDPALARLPVSGLFRADRTEAFVRLLEANFGVEAEITGDRIVLRVKPKT